MGRTRTSLIEAISKDLDRRLAYESVVEIVGGYREVLAPTAPARAVISAPMSLMGVGGSGLRRNSFTNVGKRKCISQVA